MAEKFGTSVSAVKFFVVLALLYIFLNSASQFFFALFLNLSVDEKSISVFSWSSAFLSVCISILIFNGWNLNAAVKFSSINSVPVHCLLSALAFTFLYIFFLVVVHGVSFDDFFLKSHYLYINYGFVFLFCLFIIVPFYEEVVFRGVILDFLRRNCNDYISAVAISLFFTSIHPQHFGVMSIYLFFFSLVLCFFRLRYKSIFPCILMHALYNTISFFLFGSLK